LEKSNTNKGYITEVIDLISGEKISLLDFDKLHKELKEITSMLDKYEQVTNEIEVLRQDYIQRISGMAKAIAVVKRNKNGLEQVLDFIEHLSELTAQELIEYYKKTQARFHDAFPTSFGMLFNHFQAANQRDWEVYK